MHPTRLPFSGAHWVDHVARHAFAMPESVAIRFEGESITWARLHDRVRRVAAAFAGQGVRQGDRVAILMTNRPEFVETVLATNAIGAIAVPVNFRLAPDEVAYVLQDSGACGRRHRPAARPARRGGRRRPRSARARAGPVIGPGARASSPTRPLLGRTRTATGARRSTIDERDVALIMYTSGTTGRPKGAMLTHLNLLMQAITAIRTSRLHRRRERGPGQRPAVPHRRHRRHGARAACSAPRPCSCRPRPFDAETTLDVVETERVTTLFLVPAQWQVLCAHPDVDPPRPGRCAPSPGARRRPRCPCWRRWPRPSRTPRSSRCSARPRCHR